MPSQRLPLSDRQREVFDYLAAEIERRGVAPTFEEMAKHFHRSQGALHEIVETLRRKGWVRRDNLVHSARNIEIVPDDDDELRTAARELLAALTAYDGDGSLSPAIRKLRRCLR